MGGKASKDKRLWDPSEIPMEKQLWPEQRTLFDKVPPESTEEKTPVTDHPTVADADEPPSLNKKYQRQHQAEKKRENEKHQNNHPSVEAIYRTDNEPNKNFNDDIVSMANIASSINGTLNITSPSSNNESLKNDRQQQRIGSSPTKKPRHAASRRESHGLVQPMMPPTREIN